MAESEERRERSLSSAACSSATSSSGAEEEGEEGGGEEEEGGRGGTSRKQRKKGSAEAPLRSCSPSSSSLSSSSPRAGEREAAEAKEAAEGERGEEEQQQRRQRQQQQPPSSSSSARAGGKGLRRAAAPPSNSPRPSSSSSTPYARPRDHLTPFHGAAPPPISLGAYAERLASHLRPSPLAFAHALELLDRLAKADPLASPAPDTAHRLLLASVAVAAKLTDDRVRRAEVVARVGGVPATELAGLELALLRGVGFRAHVARGELPQRVRELKVGGAGGRRGGSGEANNG